MTEASPIVALNVPSANKFGSVGQFLPGIETRLESVPGIENGKRLFIRGPNLMLGYMKHDRPGVVQPLPDGWHDTGDIVSLDENGYVEMSGRAKRFAKIGGEMVSLDVVETLAEKTSLKPDAAHAVILHQGEQDSLVLFTTDSDMNRNRLAEMVKADRLNIPGLPRDKDIIVVSALPRLATGKADYAGLQKAFNAMAQGIPAEQAVQAIIKKAASAPAPV
jgi:acyl-[acyl-carrier-protein]-phospholipid O-acyltransferase/long-chain-fatty-acid--[acyl-carrier-protein] ligase